MTIEAEEQPRLLLKTWYDLEAPNAFISLQEATITGHVKQKSRERMRAIPLHSNVLQERSCGNKRKNLS